MTTYTAQLDIGAALAPFRSCPRCGSEELLPVADGERTTFLCRSCWRCWHLELGWTSQVDPHACGTCVEQDACVARAGEDR